MQIRPDSMRTPPNLLNSSPTKSVVYALAHNQHRNKTRKDLAGGKDLKEDFTHWGIHPLHRDLVRILPRCPYGGQDPGSLQQDVAGTMTEWSMQQR
ncbi:hypothetical protein MY11210_008639 [Beauveria gryllotalpidicola]